MSWKNSIKKRKLGTYEYDEEEYNRRMKARDEASMRSGGGVDRNNPIHVEVEKILSMNYSYDEFDEMADRIKLRTKWLRKNAEYGGKD